MATKVYDNGQWKAADNAGVDSYSKTESDARYLKLSGGTMTGDIVANGGTNGFLRLPSNDNALSIFGGVDILGGSSLWLNGLQRDNTNKGCFMLGASTGTTFHWFRGTPEGDLTWKNKHIIVDDASNLTVTPSTISSGSILATKCGNFAVISFFDVSITYSSGVQVLGTVTLPTGWKSYIDGHRTNIVGDNGTVLKCWCSGAGSSTITLNTWASSSRTVGLGNGELIVPLVHE